MGLDFNPLDSITKPLEKSLGKDFKGVDKQLSGVDDQLKGINSTLNTDLGNLDKGIEQITQTLGEKFDQMQKDIAEMKKWLVGEEDAVDRKLREEARLIQKDGAFLLGAVGLVVFLNSESSLMFTSGALMLALAAYLVLP